MRVEQIMTANPAICRRDMPVQQVAKLMIEKDCGAIPVVEGTDGAPRVIGMITDRDIAVRTVAAGKCPVKTTVGETMSHPIAAVGPASTLDDCLEVMEQNQVRRVPVIDDSGCLVGIIAQADVARFADGKAAELVQRVSQGFDSGHKP